MRGSDLNAPSPGLPGSVYEHLRAIAQNKLNNERAGHTLQATALVHEAFLRLQKAGLVGQTAGPEFYWAAADSMRRILIDHARARKAVKRGGNAQRIAWEHAVTDVCDLATRASPEEIEGLDRAILRLEEHDPRAAGVVRLRFFAGLTVADVANATGATERMVKRDWEYARAWLLRELHAGPPG